MIRIYNELCLLSLTFSGILKARLHRVDNDRSVRGSIYMLLENSTRLLSDLDAHKAGKPHNMAKEL